MNVYVVSSASPFPSGWSVGRGGRRGRGVCPYKGGLPLLFVPCLLLVGLRPLAGGVPSVAYVGFSSSSLAWLLVAPGRPLAFPRGLFLSLCYLQL